MSIFPKRTLPGKTVTIHWNFNTVKLKGTHIFPFVRIGVKDPLGNVTMLFEEHVLAFPDQYVPKAEVGQKLKYLNKNIPLLVLADYLKGPYKREKLMEILQNIQSGRHYYFTYNVPNNAPLGKYELVSEVHINGTVKYSKTQPEDHFWVETVSLKSVDDKQGTHIGIVQNHSTERTPVKIVRCSTDGLGVMEVKVEVFEMLPKESKQVALSKGKDFLVYNEEREIIALTRPPTAFVLRNQQILPISKDDITWLVRKEGEEAFQLNPASKKLWDKADGLLQVNSLSEEEEEVYKEMDMEGLFKEIGL